MQTRLGNSFNAKTILLFVIIQTILCGLYVQLCGDKTTKTRQLRLQKTLRDFITTADPFLYDSTNTYWTDEVRRFCADNKKQINLYGRKVNSGIATYVWMTSPPRELFYCAIPKSSSTPWKEYLLTDLNMTWKGDMHTYAVRLGVLPFVRNENLTNSIAEFLDNYRPKHRLMIVRNPWARLASAYKDKIIRFRWTLKHICIAGDKYKQKFNVSFATFVDCVINSDRKQKWNIHVEPYSNLCALCYMDYNIIAKTEEMDVAYPYIYEKVKFKTKLYLDPPFKGKYKNPYVKYYENVTEKQIEELRSIYKTDIELFQYPNSPFE